jgi:peptide/nickel transport system substrate-binding protein
VLALGLAACGDDDENGGGSGDKTAAGGATVSDITWAIPDDIVSTDPAFNYDYTTSTVVSQVCEPLLAIDADGQLSPNLASKWDQVDDTTYRFTLRDGVKFHDGSALTPEDVKFSIERHKDPNLGSYLGQFHERVDNVEVTGPNELTVQLSEPDSTWIYATANQSSSVVSKKFVEQNGDKAGAVGKPKSGVVCTGPFKLDQWTPGQGIKVSAFADYWKGEPKVKAIDFKIVSDEQTQVAGLNSGEIDGSIQTLGGKAADTLGGAVNLLTGESVNVAFLGLNNARPPFDDKRVRQALSYAIDKAGILASAFGEHAQASKSPAPSTLWTYSEDVFKSAYDELPGYEQDLAKAKELIKQAGADGASAEILVSTPVDEEVALAIQDAGSEIGLDLKPRKLPYAQKTALEYADGEKKYDATLLTWGSDFPDPIGNLYFPFNSANVVTNVVTYKNAEVDKLLAQARGELDEAARADLLTQVQQQVVEDQPWVVYAAPDVLMPLSDRLATKYEPNGFWYFQSWADELSGAE